MCDKERTFALTHHVGSYIMLYKVVGGGCAKLNCALAVNHRKITARDIIFLQ